MYRISSVSTTGIVRVKDFESSESVKDYTVFLKSKNIKYALEIINKPIKIENKKTRQKNHRNACLVGEMVHKQLKDDYCQRVYESNLKK